MTTRAAVLFCLLAGCSGLGLHRQQPGSSSSMPWATSASELDKAETIAEQARIAAEEASRATQQTIKQIGVSISSEELDARDRNAAAESASVFKRDEKLGGVLDSMEHQADVEDKVVGGILHQSDLLRDHKFAKNTAELSKKLDNADKRMLKEMIDEDEADEKALRSAQKSFNSEERMQASQAKELHKVEKQYRSAMAHMRTERKKLEAAEAEAANRLLKEAEALRMDADNGTLSNEDVMRLLDLSQHDLSELKIQLINLRTENNTGAWFDDRLHNLRARSAAASAHMVESIRFKVAEFVSNHKDYTDRQFPALLSRLLNGTRGEINMMMNSSANIGQRMQRFEKMNPEKMTSALALAIDGVMTNLEFKSDIFRADTTRLDHSTEANACEALSTMMVVSMQPAYRSIGHMKQALDDMSKVVPTVLAHQTFSKQHLVERRMHNLLNMAYMQQLAYKESAEIIMAQVAPIVMNRLHCAFSGAPGFSGLSRAAAAAVALALGWLAQ